MNRYSFDKERHVHLLDGRPLFGTSTVVGCIQKPLSWWASGMACSKLGWTNHKVKNKAVPISERIKVAEPYLEKIKKMSVHEYIALLDSAYRAHKDKLDNTAEAGTNLHADLEAWVKYKMGLISKPAEVPRIQPFIDWAEANVEKFIWSEAYCYSETIWCGGISDVGALLKDGRLAVIDFKSSKEAYESQFIQAAGYDIQMQENGMHDAQGNLICKMPKEISVYIIFAFGAETIEPSIRENVQQLRDCFRAAVTLHSLIGKH